MLPKRFVDDGLELAKGAKIFGVPLDQLSHDELIAAVAQGWKAEESARKETRRRTEFLLSLPAV